MPSPNGVFTELVATTFRNHSKQVKDNVSKNNALLRRMMKKGKTRHEDGGTTIAATLDYAQNSTYQRYSGYDVLNIGASEVLTAAEFPWRGISISVTANGQELRINSGGSKIISLSKARLNNAMRTFKNNFSADIYSDGTLANQINGLQALISDTGTGTVGGINSATWAFWQNKVQSAAAPIQGGGSITVGPTTIEGLMLPLWLQLIRGDDKPDLIVADTNYFTAYESALVSQKRYTQAERGQGGFMELAYKSAEVMFDGGSGMPANHMYFLNTDYFELVTHPDADLTIQDEMKSINQDAAVIPILWMGNMVITNRALQGVLKA